MSAREFLLLSATEADRSGLAADLTGFIATHGCNVEDSRVVVLGGYAGLMVLLSGDPAEVKAVLDNLEQLREQSGIRAVPRRVAMRRPPPTREPSHHVVEASAIDHEGIIHALTEAVRRGGGNILELESTTEAAPDERRATLCAQDERAIPRTARRARAADERARGRRPVAGRRAGGAFGAASAGTPTLHGPERRAVPRGS